MLRRDNCWDNAPQESFFGQMKDHLMERISGATKYLIIPNLPKPPLYDKKPENLGKKKNRKQKYLLKIYVVKKQRKDITCQGCAETPVQLITVLDMGYAIG